MAQIVVVEDEEEILDLVREELEYCGHEVLTAADGEQGLALIVAEAPDLVVSDVNMPRMSGLQMRAALVAEHAKVSTTPFIFLSAFADARDIADGMAVGADHYITKPVDFDVLTGLVANMLA